MEKIQLHNGKIPNNLKMPFWLLRDPNYIYTTNHKKHLVVVTGLKK